MTTMRGGRDADSDSSDASTLDLEDDESDAEEETPDREGGVSEDEFLNQPLAISGTLLRKTWCRLAEEALAKETDLRRYVCELPRRLSRKGSGYDLIRRCIMAGLRDSPHSTCDFNVRLSLRDHIRLLLIVRGYRKRRPDVA